MEPDVPETLTLRPNSTLHFADAEGDARLMQKLTISIDSAVTSVGLRFHLRRRIAACHITLTPNGAGKITYIGLLGQDDMPFKVTLGAGDGSIILRRKPGVGPVQILLRDQSVPLHRAVPLIRGPAWESSGRSATTDAAEMERLCASISSGHSNMASLVSSTLPHIRTPDRSDLATSVLGALADNTTDDNLPLALTLLLATRG